VGDDDNGMPLTVLSALARMNVDPWEEAARLMQLPQGVAAKQLGSLLGALRNTSLANLDPALIAIPLVALLPRPAVRAHPLFRSFVQATPPKSSALVSTMLSVLTYVIFMLVSNWLLGSILEPKSTQAAATSATAISAQVTPAAREANSVSAGPLGDHRE
jgi:hypothetical protein